MEYQETRYFFIFQYSNSACFGVGADTLEEARMLFRESISRGPRRVSRRSIKRSSEKKHKILRNIDVNLIEPEIYQ